MHKHNKHSNDYNFKALIKDSPELADFVFESKYGKDTIDFANPKAVKSLNSALLKTHYGIDYWNFPDANLCPPIPGRVEYIHVLNDLLRASKLQKDVTVLDVGTGASCIYPLLGYSEYKWNFIASEVDPLAFENAKDIVDKNNLNNHIDLRFQNDSQFILKGILQPSENITATLCNPPFYKNEAEANENALRKLKGLGNGTNDLKRNFSGKANELWYPGGEKAFLHNYLYQSSLFKTNCFWYTSLVSKKELVKSMQSSLKKLGATEVKTLQMALGNKISRVMAWTFLTEEEQKSWKA
ncbi:MAG: 23S rRNA (adenine(1618)-N(6))-methyltransferase RlmF [Algicola sp.]|nr:23S rRNA (adenine(1618)-N(6))-methyltransferase RlmF [Algicola sp.]